MQTIWKFKLELGNRTKVTMPLGSRVISVSNQQNDLVIWALVTPNKLLTTKTFRIAGTGHDLEEDEEMVFIGTVQMPVGFVWHIFELID